MGVALRCGSCASALTGRRRRLRSGTLICLSTKQPSLPSSSSYSELRIAFACGGTGGHIYSAIAIADELRDAVPGGRLLFFGSATGLEAVAVPADGYNFVAVPSLRLDPLLPFSFLYCLAASFLALRRFRPHLVVGTGGNISLPVCLAAAFLRCRIVLQEQNAAPGFANCALAPLAERIYLAFNGCVRRFPKRKCVVYGNPVRKSLRRPVPKAQALAHFFPQAAAVTSAEEEQAHAPPEVVLVFGGTGGSAEINIAMLNMYCEMLAEHRNRFIIWQTGPEWFCEMESLVRANRRLLLTPFLHAMDMAYAAADIVVSCAGAMTCTEILATGKPSILIPAATAVDDHEIKNAYIMADVAGSKILVDDELDSSCLEAAINEVLGNKVMMAEMSAKARSMGRPNASVHITRSILSLLGVSSTM